MPPQKGPRPDQIQVTTGASPNEVIGLPPSLIPEWGPYGGGGSNLPDLLGDEYAVLMETPVGTTAWSRITQDMILPSYAVSLTGNQTVEIGSTISSPQFSASYTRAPVVASLYDDQGNSAINVLGQPNPLTLPYNYTFTGIGTQVAITLAANESGGPTRTGTASLTWLPRVFFGTGIAGGNSEAFIEALASSALASGRARTFSVAAGATDKIYYAFPQSFGAATFFIGGFEGGFLSPSIINVTNSLGITLAYYLYESAQAGLGSTTVEVQ